MTIYNQNFGKRGEAIAMEYLEDKGFRIIDHNVRSKFGEIDIIAEKNVKIFFVEVKTRSNLKKGKPYEAINFRKVHQLKKAATYFLLTNDYKKYKCTLSAISILFDEFGAYSLQFFENIQI
ncbi:MAG: YraN family protein [bacterium]|nr:YraN family protein [bacterium]